MASHEAHPKRGVVHSVVDLQATINQYVTDANREVAKKVSTAFSQEQEIGVTSIVITAPVGAPSRISAFIERYLFRPGGAYTIAICRILLFWYLYDHVLIDAQYTLRDGASQYLASVNFAAYTPKSLVWLLFPSIPPPAWFVDTVLAVARISTFAAIFGLATRPAMILSTLSSLFLGSLFFSWEPLWSHPYNSGLLAAIVFMFGRAGDTLSADCIVARFVLRRPVDINRDVYWWPVIMGQFGIAVVYFGGFYAKWSTPNFTYDLAWVFSDNLRNDAALPWLIRGQPLPWQVSLIANHPWLWKLSAFGHLVTQALPVFAIFSLNKPYLRLFEGFVFVFGIVMLQVVMGMANFQWLILAGFFVDWEFFARKAGVCFKRPLVGGKNQRLWAKFSVAVYCLLFVVTNLFIVVTRFDEWGHNRLYPFSSMNFYSNVAAVKPYNKHHHYSLTYGELILNYSDGSSQKWSCYSAIANAYTATHASTTDSRARVMEQVGAMKAVLATIARNGPQIGDCNGTYKAAGIDSIDLFSSIMQIPAYPKPVSFDVGHHALVSRYEKGTGRIVAASSQLAYKDGIPTFAVATQALDVRSLEILLSNDPWKNSPTGPLIKIEGKWDGAIFSVDPIFYNSLPPSWYPVVVRVTERSGRSYDFFGAMLYK